MCHACTADKYMHATRTDTGSKGMPLSVGGIGSPGTGSVTARKVKECISSNDAGKQSGSGIEKYYEIRGTCDPEP
jgi:hypothetical protein